MSRVILKRKRWCFRSRRRPTRRRRRPTDSGAGRRSRRRPARSRRWLHYLRRTTRALSRSYCRSPRERPGLDRRIPRRGIMHRRLCITCRKILKRRGLRDRPYRREGRGRLRVAFMRKSRTSRVYWTSRSGASISRNPRSRAPSRAPTPALLRGASPIRAWRSGFERLGRIATVPRRARHASFAGNDQDGERPESCFVDELLSRALRVAQVRDVYVAGFRTGGV